MRRVLLAAGVTAAVTTLAAGCSSSGASTGSGSSSGGSSSAPVTLRLGFLANITHASRAGRPQGGLLHQGPGQERHAQDLECSARAPRRPPRCWPASWTRPTSGPNPAINAWQKSSGKAIKIISGAASGGAGAGGQAEHHQRQPAQGPEAGHPVAGQHAGRRAALLPQVARADHHRRPAAATCRSRRSAPTRTRCWRSSPARSPAAGSPRRTTSRWSQDGGHVLVNEASLWPQGQFVTTSIVATQSFLAAHPSVVSGLLKGQIQANNYIHQTQTAAESGGQRRAGRAERQGLKPRDPAAGLQADHLHQRPDRLLAGHRRASTRPGGRACSSRST